MNGVVESAPHTTNWSVSLVSPRSGCAGPKLPSLNEVMPEQFTKITPLTVSLAQFGSPELIGMLCLNGTMNT
jgi:hypothetical protein